MKNGNLYKIAIAGFLLCGCILLIFSCVSFDIADPPSKYVWPRNFEVSNWCGSVGAVFAYYIMYYLGPGAIVLLLVAASGLAVRLIGKEISQLALRAIGLVLLVTTISSSWYLLWPHQQIWPYHSGSFPVGTGGVLGIAVGGFLRAHMAALGTLVIICCGWAVGAVLVADSVVLALVRWFGMGVGKAFSLVIPTFSAAKKRSKVLAEIWHRLSEQQREQESFFARFKPVGRRRSRRVPIMTQAGDRQLEAYGEPVTFESDIIAEQEDEPEVESEQTSAEAPVAKKSLKPKKPKQYIPKSYDDYRLPSLDLLESPEYAFAAVQEKMVDRKAEALEGLLAEFGINADVVNAEPGPAITMYELELAPGVKVSQITNLANDMARALGAGSVRVVAPLAGKHTIGIEAPNSQRETVRMKDLIQRAGSGPHRMAIPLFLGKSSSGEILSPDLATMPHLLIAGTTGSGKSVCINSIITSILLTRRPDEVKLILIDPKMVEMAAFDSIPHLMCPTVTETKRAEQILEWATTKMDERYELLSEAKVRNIASYNLLGAEEIIERFKPTTPDEEAKIPKKLPHMVIVIDELADLMMTAAKEIEAYIVRLAQKSRAVGIHLVVATQRPQATVVTGLIKSNMPARIGFRVAARMDSRIILDQNGAETLLGQGDMLFLKPGTSDLIRAQGAFLNDNEIRDVVKHLKEVAKPQFHPELMQLGRIDVLSMPKDDMLEEAIQLVLETKRGSVSLLQRRLSVGYARASRMIEMMGSLGILGEYKGSQAREVTMTAEEYEQAKREATEAEVAGYDDLTDEVEEEEYEEEEGGEDSMELEDEYIESAND